MPLLGITDEGEFIVRVLGGIRDFLRHDGQEAVYERLIAPATDTVNFARALNRSVTGSITDLTKQAAYLLAAGDASPFEVAPRLNETPMSAPKHDGSSRGFPRDVFKTLVSGR